MKMEMPKSGNEIKCWGRHVSRPNLSSRQNHVLSEPALSSIHQMSWLRMSEISRTSRGWSKTWEMRQLAQRQFTSTTTTICTLRKRSCPGQSSKSELWRRWKFGFQRTIASDWSRCNPSRPVNASMTFCPKSRRRSTTMLKKEQDCSQAKLAVKDLDWDWDLNSQHQVVQFDHWIASSLNPGTLRARRVLSGLTCSRQFPIITAWATQVTTTV